MGRSKRAQAARRRARARKRERETKSTAPVRSAAAKAAAVRRSRRAAEQRAAQQEARQRYDRLLPGLLLSCVGLLYVAGLWITPMSTDEAWRTSHAALWTGLLYGLAGILAACWIVGVVLTLRQREWFWLAMAVIPFTTIPGLFAYTYIRRRDLRPLIAGSASPSRSTASRGKPVPNTDGIKLLDQ